MSELSFDIAINTNDKTFRVHQTTRNGILIRMMITLSPEDAVSLNHLIVKRVAPVLAWRNTSLYKWAQRKKCNA